jgi:hypothetical protein
MSDGEWSSWGRGMSEGWSIDIGHGFRGSVVKRSEAGEPVMWVASLNMAFLGEFFEREVAMRNVEERLEGDMRVTLRDWQSYQAAKAKRPGKLD